MFFVYNLFSQLHHWIADRRRCSAARQTDRAAIHRPIIAHRCATKTNNCKRWKKTTSTWSCASTFSRIRPAKCRTRAKKRCASRLSIWRWDARTLWECIILKYMFSCFVQMCVQVETEALRSELKEKQNLICEAATALELMDQNQQTVKAEKEAALEELMQENQKLQVFTRRLIF